MRIVTRIEVVDVDESEFYQMRCDPYMRPAYPISSDSKECEPVSFEVINISGRRFVRDGKTTVIGWHKGVEELLNLPLECFENVQRDIKASKSSGYIAGKNAIWDFLKINSPDTDYWWLPIPIFVGIGLLLA